MDQSSLVISAPDPRDLDPNHDPVGSVHVCSAAQGAPCRHTLRETMRGRGLSAVGGRVTMLGRPSGLRWPTRLHWASAPERRGSAPGGRRRLDANPRGVPPAPRDCPEQDRLLSGRGGGVPAAQEGVSAARPPLPVGRAADSLAQGAGELLQATLQSVGCRGLLC